MEAPRLDLAFEEFIQLSSRASVEMSVWKHLNHRFSLVINSPCSFGDQKPHADDPRQPNTSVEQSRLETPIPFIGVHHIRSDSLHDDASDGIRCGGKPRSVRAEALGRNLSDVAPAGSAVCCNASI